MSRLWITELSGLGVDLQGRSTAMQMPPVAEQAVEIGFRSERSEQFKPMTRLVLLHADAPCWLAWGDGEELGANPDGHYMPPGVDRFYAVMGGHRVAVIGER